MKNKTPKKISHTLNQVGPYMGLGTQLAATIILMFFLGRWLDEKFHTSPYLVIIFSFLGGLAAIYNFIKEVMKLNNEKK